MTSPEALARENIDRQLSDAGWAIQDVSRINLHADQGVAVREFPLKSGYYLLYLLLYLNGKAAGVIEAKPDGATHNRRGDPDG